MMRYSATAGLLLALAACGGGPNVAEELRTCGADSYVDQLGTPLADAVLPRGPEIRVVNQGLSARLQRRNDPQRLNLLVDEASVIVGVYCG